MAWWLTLEHVGWNTLPTPKRPTFSVGQRHDEQRRPVSEHGLVAMWPESSPALRPRPGYKGKPSTPLEVASSCRPSALTVITTAPRNTCASGPRKAGSTSAAEVAPVNRVASTPWPPGSSGGDVRPVGLHGGLNTSGRMAKKAANYLIIRCTVRGSNGLGSVGRESAGGMFRLGGSFFCTFGGSSSAATGG